LTVCDFIAQQIRRYDISVRKNVCNNPKNVKVTFFQILKKNVKNSKSETTQSLWREWASSFLTIATKTDNSYQTIKVTCAACELSSKIED